MGDPCNRYASAIFYISSSSCNSACGRNAAKEGRKDIRSLYPATIHQRFDGWVDSGYCSTSSLAIAFAIASGVSPEKGLYTAVIAGFIISAMGGSRVQIGGPTGAFIVIVYGIVQQYGVNGLIIATFIAGVMLIIMGLARLGSVIKFIPHPLIIGFTSGIALIFSSQMKDFFGLQMGAVPADFIDKWEIYFANFQTINVHAFLIAAATVLIVFLWPKITHKIPGSLTVNRRRILENNGSKKTILPGPFKMIAYKYFAKTKVVSKNNFYQSLKTTPLIRFQ